MQRLTVAALALVALAPACSDSDDSDSSEATSEDAVEGPALDVSGPETAQLGSVVQVDIAVEGVELVDPAEDSSEKDGSAGHLHLFVNQEPTPPGEPIPVDDPAVVHTTSQSVAFPADLFTEGANTIWVVLGHADHTPFEPPVADHVDIEVVPPG